MKLSVQEVTPAQAKAWLKTNTLNRPVRKFYVKHLAEAMKRGEWQVNHQAIAVNGTRLLDGQHRLMALLESGLPSLKMSVITGAETETFDTIDIGVKRSHADIFREDIAVMGAISFVARLVHGTRVTAVQTKPICEKLRRQMREIVDLFPRSLKRWGASPIRAAALAAILDGERKEYVFALYKAMAEFDTANIPPIGASFVRQVINDKWSSSGQSADEILVKAFTVFHEENAAQQKVQVKKAGDRKAIIRELFRAHLGIKP